jgi:hypothetical protein
MADAQIGVEQIDGAGSTSHFNGTVSTTAISIPTIANKVISEFCIANVDLNKSAVISVSLDGGTTYKQIGFNGEWSWSLKGYQKQIKIKGDAASRAYEIVVNFEAF